MSYCKVLYDVFFIMFVNRGDLVKILVFFNMLVCIVVWFLIIVIVCCDLSNLFDVIFFFIFVCVFIEYMSNIKEIEKLKVDILVVYGRVLIL